MDIQEDCEKLTPALLAPNLSERTSVKFTMNCILGKLGQGPNQTSVEFVSDDARLDALFSDKSLDIHNAFQVTDDVMQVNFLKKETFVKDSRKHHPILNALVTAKARILLYNAIKTVQDAGCDILYTDTDSIILGYDPHRVQDVGLFRHDTIFGAWKDEVPAGLYIGRFLGLR